MNARSIKEHSETDKQHKISQYSAVLWNEKSLPRQCRCNCTVHNGFLLSNNLSIQQTPYVYTSIFIMVIQLEALQRQTILVYYGSGCVVPGLTRIFFLENHPKIALKQY